MKTLTESYTEISKIDKDLKVLYDHAQKISDKYSYDVWTYGDVPISDKRTYTMRFNKFYKAARAAGYDLLSTMPFFLKPNYDSSQYNLDK